MTTPDALAVVVAALAAGWAALLALAEESPKVSRALVEGAHTETGSATPYRIVHASRLSLLFIAAVAAAQAGEWWQRGPAAGVGVAFVSVGFLFMIGEALPRAIAALAPEVAAAAAPFAERTTVVFRPLLALLGGVERVLPRALPKPRSGERGLGSAQRDLLMGVFSLGETTVEDIMTPRLDISAVDDSAEWHDVIDVVRRSEHGRIPVYTDTLDNVVGVLYAKDLVPAVGGAEPAPDRWQDLVRPAQFVPETKPLSVQLRDFQRGPSHIVVVVDEFGGTAGLVTLEDVLEEVVGEIHNEYDIDEKPAIEREGVDKFWVAGGVTLDELSALLERNLEQEDVSTVGGFVYAQLGRVPNPGDAFEVAGFRVVVEQVVHRRVRRVYFERLAPAAHGQSPGSRT
ncbi:MAG: hemolysin family protein [Gemmatimonadetes bacterium]|nr:hemolysin family protein [Gemmatimonadota bacterium]